MIGLYDLQRSLFDAQSLPHRVPADSFYGRVNEVTTRGGRATAIAAEHQALRANVHDYLVVPEADRFVSPILATVPAQLVAYHMSVARGIDPDFPRNLSKTLTVD